MWRAAVALLALAGCYSPSITDGQFTCATASACPSGFDCQCGFCRPNGSNGCADFGGTGAGDAAPADFSSPGGGDLRAGPPCTNGPPSQQDPHVAGVALCPAAWLVPGINSAAALLRPCNRMPTPDGKDAQGTSCSAADNCGVGWHVCAGEAELSLHGFDGSKCTALESSGALWITRQAGDVPPGAPPGPPSCSLATEHIVFGCGDLGMMGTQSCTVLNRVVLDIPNNGMDDCSLNTGGVFLCTGVGPGMPEAHVVTKPALAGGGVMCCVD